MVFSVPLRAGENVLPNGKQLFVEKKIPEKEENRPGKFIICYSKTFRIVIKLRMFREYGRGARAVFSDRRARRDEIGQKNPE